MVVSWMISRSEERAAIKCATPTVVMHTGDCPDKLIAQHALSSIGAPPCRLAPAIRSPASSLPDEALAVLRWH
jgi:hypothetical protein